MFDDVDPAWVLMWVVLGTLVSFWVYYETRKRWREDQEFAEYQARLANELAHSVCEKIDGEYAHCMITTPSGVKYLSAAGVVWHYANTGNEVSWGRNQHLESVWRTGRARADAQAMGTYRRKGGS